MHGIIDIARRTSHFSQHRYCATFALSEDVESRLDGHIAGTNTVAALNIHSRSRDS